MSDSITLIAALAVPTIILSVLRINAVMVFLSLCLGSVLVRYVGFDSSGLLSLFSAHGVNSITYSTIQLALLLGPAIATAVFMIFTVHGHFKTMLNILPAAGTALLGVLLSIPLFTPGLRYSIESQTLWIQLTRAETLLIGVSGLISLLFLWTQRPKHKHEGKKKHRD